MIPVQMTQRNADVKTPEYATLGAAGFDLFADTFSVWDDQLKKIKLITSEDGAPATIIKLNPGYRILVGTGLKVAIPFGAEMQIRPRSGLALKQGLTVLNSPGTIDSDYRGEIGVILINHGRDAITLTKGDAIAQGIIATVLTAEFNIVSDLPITERMQGGFGSTTKQS